MPDFGIFRGFNDKLFSNKLYAGQLPTQLGTIGSVVIPILLLDLYPGAAAAYSLRKLRSAYTGSAIRVRRTDLAESDIGFTSTGELDTTALLAFTGTGALDNGFVTTWYDQSGNGRNATQTTALNQPQIVSSGSVILKNGKPSVQFDGTNDGLLANKINNTTGTMFAVQKSTPNGGVFIAQATGLNGSDFFAVQFAVKADSQNNSTRIFNTNLAIWYGDKNTLNSQNLITLNSNGSNWVLHIDGLPQTINNLVGSGEGAWFGTYNGNLALGFINDSTPTYNEGAVQEIILYPSDQSSNRTGIETNINDFYSIY
jgi:hypothetical protein